MVVVIARTIPADSMSSWVVEGLLEGLMGYNWKVAAFLREMYHIYIVPMLNVDGVVTGNTITNIFGQDISIVDLN